MGEVLLIRGFAATLAILVAAACARTSAPPTGSPRAADAGGALFSDEHAELIRLRATQRYGCDRENPNDRLVQRTVDDYIALIKARVDDPHASESVRTQIIATNAACAGLAECDWVLCAQSHGDTNP